MSETKDTTGQPQTQKQRWLKYGANVALASVVVVLLAVVVTWLAQAYSAQVDTTTGRLYSLKPQTINIIKNNDKPVRIVSLYTNTRPADYGSAEATSADAVQRVNDLLDEYRRKGKNVSVESIDPIAQPTKVDQLIEEVANKYGGEVKKYQSVIQEYPAVYDQITKLANAEAQKVAALPIDKVTDQDLGQTLFLTIATVQGFPKFLEKTKEPIEKRLKQKPPDYRGAVDSVLEGMEALSQMAGQIVDDFNKSKGDAKVPQEIRTYMTESLPRYEQVRKLAEDLAKRIRDLGELKLDELRKSLRDRDKRDAILVMGPDEMRVITRDKVWQRPADLRGAADEKVKPRFAGEQQITSAILAVTAKSKKKVAFVRPGGPPLATPEVPMFQRGGPLGLIAERLRDYNFDVVEKDLSGMWAMQAQMQGMPAAPEPSEEELKDAVWVVLNIPSARSPMGGPPPSIAPKLAAHLAAGGSAMVMTLPSTMRSPVDNLAEALEPWGIRMRTDALAVHEPVKAAAGRAGDMIEEAQRVPMIFVTKEYGDHLLTRPLRSLDGLLFPQIVVETNAKQGYRVERILPVPQTLKSWGETKNIDGLMEGDTSDVAFEPAKPGEAGGDIAPPIWSGAVAEKIDGGGRLVVIGSIQFAINDILRIRDPQLASQGVYVARFPGNAELFCNSVFWLARMEPMIAISPSAMEVSRIGEMSKGTLNFWRFGVLLVGLPLLVLAAGTLMYMARRD